jgi:parallel beta-helix repeat protein
MLPAILLLLIVLSSSLAFFPVPVFASTIYMSPACGTTIVEPSGTTVVLTADVGPCLGREDGLDIGANGIILDCAGYTISGSIAYSTAGIALDRTANVTVKNCNVTGFVRDFFLSFSFNNTLSGNTATGASDGCGFTLRNSSINTFSGNTAIRNGCGFYLLFSPGNTFRGNTASSNAQEGFVLYSSSNNTLAENMANSNTIGYLDDSTGPGTAGTSDFYTGDICIGNVTDSYPRGLCAPSLTVTTTTYTTTITTATPTTYTTTITTPTTTMATTTITTATPTTYATTITTTASVQPPIGEQITLSSTTGSPGDSITIIGSGPVPGKAITVTFGITVVSKTCFVDARGLLSSCAFVVPDLPAGTYTVFVSDLAVFTFTVVPSISLAPVSGPTGIVVLVKGAGFAPLHVVTLASFGSSGPVQPLGTCRTSRLGTFSCRFKVPTSPDGIQTLTFTDGTNTATTSFKVGSIVLKCNTVTPIVGVRDYCRLTVKGLYPTGTVSWSSGGSGSFSASQCTPRLGSCAVWFTPTTVGSLSITASYGGSFPGTASIGLKVAWKTTKTVVSCTPRSAVAGSSTTTTCTARVIGYLPTGVVSWWQGGTGSVSFSSATCTLVAGKCSITMTGSSLGTVAITASYGGDPNNLGSHRAAKLTIA